MATDREKEQICFGKLLSQNAAELGVELKTLMVLTNVGIIRTFELNNGRLAIFSSNDGTCYVVPLGVTQEEVLFLQQLLIAHLMSQSEALRLSMNGTPAKEKLRKQQQQLGMEETIAIHSAMLIPPGAAHQVFRQI